MWEEACHASRMSQRHARESSLRYPTPTTSPASTCPRTRGKPFAILCVSLGSMARGALGRMGVRRRERRPSTTLWRYWKRNQMYRIEYQVIRAIRPLFAYGLHDEVSSSVYNRHKGYCGGGDLGSAARTEVRRTNLYPFSRHPKCT